MRAGTVLPYGCGASGNAPMREPGRPCEVVLDDKHGVAQVHESTRHLDQAGGVDGRLTGDGDAPALGTARATAVRADLLDQRLLGLFAVGDAEWRRTERRT
ncbi:hypothetical protein HOK021_40650 [Streptomyces hygroscopicus]|nr:hypothetical protein HOK021_40650 [Streptomyces hygroscopicus]